MPNLVILAALVFEISFRKTDKQTNRRTSAAENPPTRPPSFWVNMATHVHTIHQSFIPLHNGDLFRRRTRPLVLESWAKSLPRKASSIGANTVNFWSSGTSLVVSSGTRSRSPTSGVAESIVPENSLPAKNKQNNNLLNVTYDVERTYKRFQHFYVW